MALNIAIGELQKNLGPDKRTSANAELVSSTFDILDNRINKNPYWVGAWNAEGGLRGWLVSGNENLTQPVDPAADVTASSMAVTPLDVVAPAAVTADKPTGHTITTQSISLPTLPAVLLVGDSTIGNTGTAAQRYVFAPVRDINAIPAGATTPTTIGRYAWWVGDEGVKANLASPVAPLPTATPADRLKFLAAPQNRGLPTLGSPWDRWLPEYSGAEQITDFADAQKKLLTRNQIPIASAGLSDAEKSLFHEFTTVSAGVLSDSKNGGLRKDLSIAFEISENLFKNTEFTKVLTSGDQPCAFDTNHALISHYLPPGSSTLSTISTSVTRLKSGTPFAGRSTKTAINFHDPTWQVESDYSSSYPWVYRGPTFDQLRDHYQLYRRVNQPMSSNAMIDAQTFLPNASVVASPAKQRSPWRDYAGQVNGVLNISSPEIPKQGANYAVQDTYAESSSKSYARIRPMTTELVPELIRFTYTFALQSFPDPATPGKSQLRVIVTPYVVLHNPYNVTLRSKPLLLNAIRAEMEFKLTAPADSSFGEPAINTGWFYIEGYLHSINLGSAYELSLDCILTDDGDPASSLTLKPGEVKLFTMTGNHATDIAVLTGGGFTSSAKLYFQSNDTSNLFSSGFSMTFRNMTGNVTSVPFSIRSDRNFTVSVQNVSVGQTEGAGYPVMVWPVVEWYELTTSLMDQPNPTDYDQITKVQFWNFTYWSGPVQFSGTTIFNANQVPDMPNSDTRRYIARSDMYLKPAYEPEFPSPPGPALGFLRDNNFTMATHNPRAMVQSNPTAGNQGPDSTRGPATWTGSIQRLNSATPGFDNRFWGSGTTPADGGQANVTLWDIPRAPMTAIASFQNANLSRMLTSPAYAVGNSYASPYVPSDNVWARSGKLPGSKAQERAAGVNTPNYRYWNFDDSYIFNNALFDSYFFSGVNPGFAGNAWKNTLPAPSVTLASDPTDVSLLQTQINDWMTGAKPLLNQNFIFTLPSGRSMAEAQDDLNLTMRYGIAQTALAAAGDIRPHNAVAAYMLNVGAFNVNSISVTAWRTLLAGLRGATVDHFSSPTSLGTDSSTTGTPFPRTSLPGGDSDTGSDDKLWNGFRRLTDTEINNLATEIVTEIMNRARNRNKPKGRPFTTLGEFINRRIEDSNNVANTTSYRLKGVLQAAIDRSINQPGNLSNVAILADPSTKAQSHYQTRKKLASPETITDPFANPSALDTLSPITGAPQWLMQADLLERIGPQLSARSDTFTVRTYGESVNPATGVVQGRAWLEAIVQRETGYVNPADHPALPISALSASSLTFGRRFRVVSFRWLSASDI